MLGLRAAAQARRNAERLRESIVAPYGSGVCSTPGSRWRGCRFACPPEGLGGSALGSARAAPRSERRLRACQAMPLRDVKTLGHTSPFAASTPGSAGRIH